MHGQQKIGGFDQVVGGDRRRFADAALGKRQADLLLGVFVLAIIHHQASDGQTRFDAVRVRRIQSAREAIHRGFAVAQRQQRVAGIEQDRRLFSARPLGRFDVAQRFVALAQVSVGMRHLRIDQRIVRRNAQRMRSRRQSTADSGACRTSVSASARCSARSLGAYLKAARYSCSALPSRCCWR